MKVLHFDCFSGVSGDMTLGALIDAGVSADAVRAGIASLGLPITLEIEKVRKGGFAATQVRVQAPEQDKHRHLHHVEAILSGGKLTDRQRDLALRIFRRLAEAEAAVHGIAVERVHFHEVGALDSIADIAGAAIALDLLGAEHVTSRSVPTGHGTVICAHGVMPIPTPATAELLKGVPLAPSPIQAELTTPTGAAILTTVVREWVEAPAMTISSVGHGAGTKNFPEQPNLLRVFVGEAAACGFATAKPQAASPYEADEVWVLETNHDDQPAEVIGYCYDLLLATGALDVFATPVQMKKSRPGVLLTVLSPREAVDALEEILFRETTTLGVRRYAAARHKLHREARTVETPFGSVKGKIAWREGRPPTFAPEYEDCARVAREHGIALRNVYAAAARAFELAHA